MHRVVNVKQTLTRKNNTHKQCGLGGGERGANGIGKQKSDTVVADKSLLVGSAYERAIELRFTSKGQRPFFSVSRERFSNTLYTHCTFRSQSSAGSSERNYHGNLRLFPH